VVVQNDSRARPLALKTFPPLLDGGEGGLYQKAAQLGGVGNNSPLARGIEDGTGGGVQRHPMEIRRASLTFPAHIDQVPVQNGGAA